MKKIFLSIIIGAMALSAMAQTVVVDNYKSLQLKFTVDEPVIRDVSVQGQPFVSVSMDGYMPSSQVGAPSLPTFSRLIEVPICAGYEVSITDVAYDTLSVKRRLIPVQAPRSKSDTSFHPLVIDSKIYSTNEYFGIIGANVETVGIARDRRLARLQFSPVNYNPVSGQLIVCRKATVTIRYIEPDIAATETLFNRYYSPAFNSGSNALNDLYPKAVRTTAPVRYVIVANSMFRGYLDTFVQWKRHKGFITDIVYTDNTAVGTTTTSIAAYLKGLYDNATADSPAPTYVLLVGDVEQLPAFSAQVTSPSSSHVTDLYYSTWTTGDHLPDCHYGRFSAQSVAQLTPQVEKTLMYEQYTFNDPSFLDRAVMVAGVDGGTAGDYGYTHADPAMDYAVTNYVNGNHGWSQVMYFKNNTSIVPSVMTNVTIGSSASGNAATVRTYYNQGAGFINYSAHGGSTGWGTPNFGNTHVNSMTNYQKFGLMIGNCCLTNKFEESTCFGEALLRKGEYAGAVGYIGGSNSTYWDHDFYWAVGIRSSIGPSMSMAYNASNLGVYDRVFHTHNESYSQWCTTQGSMVMQGNMAVESSSASSNYKYYYWEIYHLMGDPSVMPYMTQADTMNVGVQSMITFGTTTLNVTAAPNAYVTLVDTVTYTLIAAAYANASGNAMLTLPADLPVGYYQLVASAQQYRTAFRTIRVIQPAGAFPIVSYITSAPLNAGDTVALTLHVENPGNATANNIVITLTSSNPQLTLSTTTVSVASLAAGASVDIPTAVSAYVSASAPDNTYADISTSTTWTGSTAAATSTLRLWLYAPVLYITFSNDNPTMMPGGNATVTATLHNSGHAPSQLDQLTFSSPTAMLTVSPAFSAPVSLAADGQTTVNLTLQASAQLPESITLPITCSYGTFSDSLPVYIGQSFAETFEGGSTHLAGWNPPSAYPWAVSTQQPYEGSYCLRSVQYTSHNMNSDMSININVVSAGTVSFYYRVSSESGWDKFHFLIDSVSQMNASGEVEWTHAAFPLTAGNHILTFRYAKDGSVSSGSDCAWVDNVILPHHSYPTAFVNEVVCSDDTTGLPAVAMTSDSVVAFYSYTIQPSGVDYDTAEACGNYMWRGNTYDASNTYCDTVPIVAGCDSIYMLALTVHPLVEVYDTIHACDRYTWGGNEYTVSTTVTDHHTDVYGCDSTVILRLAIHPTLYGTVFDSVDDEDYIWNDSVYTESGVYRQYLTTVYGCDSIVTLVLTINRTNNGIQQLSDETVTVYPSPTTGIVNFSTLVDEVVVFDLSGRAVGRWSNAQNVDISALPKGTYLFNIKVGDGIASCRVILQ